MEDSQIVELYWRRDEAAIAQTQQIYGNYCRVIACNILQDPQDAEEVVNDTYSAAWNTIPPHRPEMLSTFLGKITRRLALKKRRELTAEKRGGGEVALAFDELEECVPVQGGPEPELETKELALHIDAFLASLSAPRRRVFLCRYWYFDSIGDICQRFGYSQSKVKMMLKRTRESLNDYLKKEGVLS